jgi:hypothetical protein
MSEIIKECYRKSFVAVPLTVLLGAFIWIFPIESARLDSNHDANGGKIRTALVMIGVSGVLLGIGVYQSGKVHKK